LDILFIYTLRVVRVFVFSVVFIAEDVDGIGEGVRRYHESTDTVGGLFEHVPEICLFH
jgi:hypothetical protein